MPFPFPSSPFLSPGSSKARTGPVAQEATVRPLLRAVDLSPRFGHWYTVSLPYEGLCSQTASELTWLVRALHMPTGGVAQALCP